MLNSSDPGLVRVDPASETTLEAASATRRDLAVIQPGLVRFPASLRTIAFAAGDVIHMIGVTVAAAWAANIAHRPIWGMTVGVLVGMSLAMLAQTTLAWMQSR